MMDRFTKNASQITDRLQLNKFEQGSDKELKDQASERPQQEMGQKPFLDTHTIVPSSHANITRVALQTDKRNHTPSVQNPMSANNDTITSFGPSLTEGLSQETLLEKAVFMKTNPSAITTQSQDDQQRWGDILSDQLITKQDRLNSPFRLEMTNIQTTLELRPSASNGPSEINTQAVIDQIINAKQFLNNGMGRVQITLDPPNLGTVNLEIIIRKQRVELVMTAENTSVQQALQSRADEIRTAFQRHDLKIEAFQVVLQENTVNQQHTQNSSFFERRHDNQPRQNQLNEDKPIQPLVQSMREFEPAKGLVSIFA
jgi:hypothetical protein